MKQFLELYGKIDGSKVETAGRRYLTVKFTVDASAKLVDVGTAPNEEDKAKAIAEMPAGFSAMLADYERKAKANQAARNKGVQTNRWTIKVKACKA